MENMSSEFQTLCKYKFRDGCLQPSKCGIHMTLHTKMEIWLSGWGTQTHLKYEEAKCSLKTCPILKQIHDSLSQYLVKASPECLSPTHLHQRRWMWQVFIACKYIRETYPLAMHLRIRVESYTSNSIIRDLELRATSSLSVPTKLLEKDSSFTRSG